MSDSDLAAVVDACREKTLTSGDQGLFKDEKMKSFFGEYYGVSEGNRVRSRDAGWVCAQRRVGRALGWLHSKYSGGDGDDKVDVPDYLMVVDDDTYVDLVDVMSYLEKEAEKKKGEGGRMWIIPFPIAYGGFGTILNKAAIRQLSEPIVCNNSGTTNQNVVAICAQIKADRVGEASMFQDGMTVFELFYKYSATKDFCMHSDWLLGYILEYYIDQHPSSLMEEGDHDHTLIGMKTYPTCGNITVATGAVRPCTQFSDTCHNQQPKDMEVLAMLSFVQSPVCPVSREL
ncbi:hypothetical protein ACHAWO_004008 [Cyclotella atomus]|uniref:Hexosyltransferase n=1 Tax=Cyclotella atomus TaxID=382360 RepID=A0ABD3NIU2_9STRA